METMEIVDKAVLAELQRDRRLKLIETLESGQYKQGKKVLAHTKTGRYCCLGVACELARADGLDIRVEEGFSYGMGGRKYPVTKYDGEATLMPTSVQEYYGFYSGSGNEIEYTTSRGEPMATVVEMNDRGLPFVTIADTMRKFWINGPAED